VKQFHFLIKKLNDLLILMQFLSVLKQELQQLLDLLVMKSVNQISNEFFLPEKELDMLDESRVQVSID
jgi:hypothetical protein